MMLKRFLVALAIATTGCASTGVKKPYSAFDVAQRYQMIGPMLCCELEAPLIQGDSHKTYLPKLVDFANKLNIDVIFLDEPLFGNPHLWGINLGPFILIRSSFPLNTQVATLAHELGHSFQPKNLNEVDAQLFAETVSIVYCKRIGLEVWQSSFTYFGQYNVKEHADFIRYHSKEIDAVVDKFLAGE